MSGTVTTSVEMANVALSHLDEPALSAFDFSSKPARWFKNNYEAYRDAYLARHDWDFATELLYLPTDAEEPPFRWRYQYKKPIDTLRLPQQTVDGCPDGQPIVFEVVGQRILTDWSPPFPLRHIRRVTRETEFSPLFVHGFGLFLASGCAHVITGKNSRAEALRQAAEEALLKATAYDATQGRPLPFLNLDIITDR